MEKFTYTYVCMCFFFSEDVNECMDTNDCDVNAQCNNTIGSYFCTCNMGYVGDGLNCTGNGTEIFCIALDYVSLYHIILSLDIDECQDQPCDSHATCNNTDGSFNCSCNHGFYGNGRSCCKLRYKLC